MRLCISLALVLARCAPGAERPLGSIGQVLQLTNEEAAQGRPFHLRAQVMLFDWDAYYLFLQDGPLGIYSARPDANVALKQGDWIEAEGVTARGGYAPNLKVQRIKFIRHGSMPAAARPDIARPTIPESANVWALTRGRIVRADYRIQYGNTFITLYQRFPNGTEMTIILASSAGCSRAALVDADVEVHGIIGTQYGGAGNRQSDMMFVPNCASISILTRPSPDWSLPLKDLRNLLTYHSGVVVNDMVRIRGTVTLAATPDQFYIQKSDRGILVEPIDQTAAVHVGEGVEVLGRVIQDQQGIRRIVAARVHPLSAPEPIEIMGLTTGNTEAPFADALINVESEVLSREQTPERVVLGMRVWNQDITVEMPLPKGMAADRLPEIQDRVSITGVARVRPETRDRRFEIRLTPRGWDDVQIVKKRPLKDRIPWGRVALAAGTVAFAASLWILALRNRVRARTSQLEEARLDAERASRAKGEFLANMSHEIRTPMNGILAATELTLQTDLTAQQRNLIETAQSSTESLLTIINDILDFSKIEAGKLTLDPTPFSLRPMLDGVLKSHQLTIGKKGLKLLCTVQPRVPERIFADRTRVTQIINNLVGNAVKFTSRGEIEVQVDMEGYSAGGACLHVSVRDTGIGIPESKRQSIFEAFAQADTSTTRQFGGTGLGLSISVELVKLLGGRLWVESKGDTGSCFHFTFLAPVAESATPLETAAAPEAQAVAARILLAEDNPVNQMLAKMLLEKLGHTVAAASNGREVIELWESQPFDLILMDVQMPVMDGFEATAAIRQKEKRSGAHIPIVALTAHAMVGDAERCIAAGMDGYASKPIRPKELQKEIQRLHRAQTVMG